MSNSIIGKFPISILNPILMKNIPTIQEDEDSNRSCHHCRAHKRTDFLVYCQHIHPSGKKCRKKYCNCCLRKMYNQALFAVGGNKCFLNLTPEMEVYFNRAESIYRISQEHNPRFFEDYENAMPGFLKYAAAPMELQQSIDFAEWMCPSCNDSCVCTVCKSAPLKVAPVKTPKTPKVPKSSTKKAGKGLKLSIGDESPTTDVMGWNFGVKSPLLILKKLNAKLFSPKNSTFTKFFEGSNALSTATSSPKSTDNESSTEFTGIFIPKATSSIKKEVVTTCTNDFIVIPTFVSNSSRASSPLSFNSTATSRVGSPLMFNSLNSPVKIEIST